MSLIIQKDGGSTPTSKRVWYNAGAVTVHPVAGYAVCYDVAEGLTPDDDEFGELVRGNTVVKPATANLLFFAGVIKSVSATKGADGYSCWVDIILPVRGEWCSAYCHSNATIGTTVLNVADGDWGLVTDATPYDSGGAIAMAGETADTSTTAANKLIMFI